MQRYLIIGVGGSGGNTVRYVARELERRLMGTGWTGGLPQSWRFIHIDVREQDNDLDGTMPRSLRLADSHLGLANYPQKYQYYDGMVTSDQRLLEASARWRPDPAVRFNNPYEGAGQLRAVGRIITITQLGRVARMVDEALSAMATNEANAELDELALHLGDNDGAPPAQPGRAIVISSLGGGAGSGAYLDIIQLLRARATSTSAWLSEPLSVLFASDIFTGLPPGARKGVEPNSLAAISELLAAYEHQGPLHPTEAAVAELGGGAGSLDGMLSPPYNMIIGRKNAHLDLGTTSAVYAATGKALATFIGSPSVQKHFDTYLTGNWSGPPLRISILTPGKVHPCSSFGYGSVTLGRTLLARYGAEVLAGRVLQRLTRGHLEDVPTGAFVREETVIASRADEREPSFFEASGLWELGLDHNQVLDTLRDRVAKGRALDNLRDRVLQRLGERRTKLGTGEWKALFWETFDVEANAYIKSEANSVAERSREWASGVQERLIRAVETEIAVGGLPLTIELLDRLAGQVTEAVKELRRADHEFREKEEGGFQKAAAAVFDNLKEKTIGSAHACFEQAATDRRKALSRRTEADLYAFAADLLGDVNDRCLAPLRQAVSTLLSSLSTDLAQVETRRHVEQWSTGPLGIHLRPTPNEELLDPPEEFPSLLADRLMSTFEVAAPEDAISLAVREIVSGVWASRDNPDEEAVQSQLFATLRTWSPARSEARTEGRSSSSAMFSSGLTALDLLDWATGWVQNRRGPVSETVRQSLRDWLDPSEPSAAERAERFVGAFARALKHGSPMASVSSSALAAAHQVEGKPALGQYPISSPIPLASNHRARARVEQALRDVGVDAGRLPDFFDPNYSGGEVEIVSFLSECVHPVVFDSIFAPISQDWVAKRGNAQLRREWWLYRRGRSLQYFTPAPPSAQRAMVRGWLTARTLGYVPSDPREWADGPLSVWSPKGRLSFPSVLFSNSRDPRMVLPSLFESLPLAYLTLSGGDRSEIGAYERLAQLGTRTDSTFGPIEDLNEELEGWIRDGVLPEAEPTFPAAATPDESRAGPAGGSPEERAKPILERLALTRSDIESEVMTARITPQTSLTVDPRWELRDLYVRAAEDLYRWVEHSAADAIARTSPAVPKSTE